MFSLNKVKIIYILLIGFLSISFLIANFVLAEELPKRLEIASCPSGPKWLQDVYGIANGLLIPCECLKSYTPDEMKANPVPCGTKEVMQTIINFSKLILSLVGSLALLMFFYGGITWILAGGSAEKIEKGKKIIVGATIGIVIILGAWVIVNFVIFALTGGTTGEIFPGGNWAQIWSKPSQSGVSGGAH